MKRIFLISVFAGITLACAFGQTYYYEHTESVDANGVRTKGSGKGMYITFTSNSCYESDKDGHAKETKIYSNCQFQFSFVLNFQYKGKQSDWHEFVHDVQILCEGMSRQTNNPLLPSAYTSCMCNVNYEIQYNGRYKYYYFNSDYSRMNYRIEKSGNTQVWVRTTPTEDRKPSAPSQFY